MFNSFSISLAIVFLPFSLLDPPRASGEALLLFHFPRDWTEVEGVDHCGAFVRSGKACSMVMVDESGV